MTMLFQNVWSRSLLAVWVIPVVIFVRFLLQRVPRRYLCLLWLPVLIRLLCPALPLAGPSLIPEEIRGWAHRWSGPEGREEGSLREGAEGSRGLGVQEWQQFQQEMAEGAGWQFGQKAPAYPWQQPGEQEPEPWEKPSVWEAADSPSGDGNSETVSKADTTYIIEETEQKMSPSPWIEWGSILWLAGSLGLLFWNLRGLWLLRGRLHLGREPLEPEALAIAGGLSQKTERIWQVPGLEMPFVLGIICPRIYLPKGLKKEELLYILCHEETHIKRRDPLWKALGFLTLCLYWFHPLVWLAFYLAAQDLEMACDESVLARLGRGVREDYSAALMRLSLGHSLPGRVPAAFGEGNPKRRIRHILQYEKPSLLAGCGAVAVIFILGAGLLLNGKGAEPSHMALMRSALLENTGDAEWLVAGHKGEEAALDGEKQADIWVPDPKAWDTRPARERLPELFAILTDQNLPHSDPQAYLDAQPEAFQKLLEQPQAAMAYCFDQFEQGGQTGLSGRLMAEFCRHCMGKAAEPFPYESGQQWYEAVKGEALQAQQEQERENIEKYQMLSWYMLRYLDGELEKYGNEICLPDYTYEGEDKLLKLLYETEKSRKEGETQGFTLWAVHSYGAYEENNQCKLLAVVYTGQYRLFGEQPEKIGGSVIPVSLTCELQADGSYKLLDYQTAADGSSFKPSIEALCTMPKSGAPIPGLAEEILAEYGNDQSLTRTIKENLREHLKKYV